MTEPGEALPSRAAQFEAHFAAPAAYTVPYDWGRLLVTHEAHDAYGLVPLTGETVDGNVPTEIEKDKLVEMALLGPGELVAIEAPPRPEPQEGTFPASIYTYLQRDDRAQLVFGYTVDAAEMLQISLRKAAREQGVSPAEIERHFVDELHRIPARERIEHEIPQALVHGVLPVMHRALFDILATRKLQSSSLGSRLLSGLFGGNMRLAVQAGTITDDFHETFCSENFNRQFSSAGVVEPERYIDIREDPDA
jgi:hypothetical protein